MKDKATRFNYRKERTRDQLRRRIDDRPRLSVFRSLRYIYAQVIDDASGKTLAAASSLTKDLKSSKVGKNLSAAKRIGALIAANALAAGVKKVKFDRGAYPYHGRVKVLAEAARTGGLEF